MQSFASNNLQGLQHFFGSVKLIIFCFRKSKLLKQYVAENERLRAILGEWSMRAAKVKSSLVSSLYVLEMQYVGGKKVLSQLF